MTLRWLTGLLASLLAGLASSALAAPAQFPKNPTFTTYFVAPPGGIEGLTGDDNGNFYVADRTPNHCFVWKIDTKLPAPNGVKVGEIGVLGCTPQGLTFDRNGDLYITDVSTIHKLTPAAINPLPIASLFASGVPGANGVAFDRRGNLLVTDGTNNQGKV